MAGRFDRIIDKANQKAEEVIGTSSKEVGQGEEDQEYYEPRSPDQIKEDGMVVLTRGQVEEQQSREVDGGTGAGEGGRTG